LALAGDDYLTIRRSTQNEDNAQFPIDTIIYGMDWAADGKSILVNANKKLTRVILE
jgi:transcriptional activator of cad operon